MTSPQLLDAASLLDLELQGTSLIEASAGTGKTYTIANLYLRHILLGRKPGEILVVSFTNAATDELSQRIRARLYQALAVLDSAVAGDDEFLACLLNQQQSLGDEQQQLHKMRLRHALRSMDESAISTIHGFCQSALQDHALLSKRQFESELIADDSMFWNQALKDWWRSHNYPLSDSSWQLFNAAIPSLHEFLDWQKQMRNHPVEVVLPEVAESLEQIYSDWAALEGQLQELAQQWQQQSGDLFKLLQESDVLSRAKTSPYALALLPDLYQLLDDYFNADNLMLVPQQLRQLTAASLDKYSKPAKRGQEAGFQHPFFVTCEEIFHQIDGLQLALRVRALQQAYAFAASRVTQRKQEAQQLAYQDQLSLMLLALQEDKDEALTRRLRERFPVAMIDEFQDTDPTQYQIFRHLYFDNASTSLTLIGDPKQAIYSFRGGDVFTYIRARQESGMRRYSLLTNWRSDAALIDAVNHFFAGKEHPFIYHQAIEFQPAIPAPTQPQSSMTLAGASVTPLMLWHIPLRDDGKTFLVGDIRARINRAISAEILRLLAPAANTEVAGRPLQSGDIAILVRTGAEGEALRKSLAESGIRSVTIGKEKVFGSDEARGLYALLEAIAMPEDGASLRRARASSLFNLDYVQLGAAIDLDRPWQDWIDQLRDLHDSWNRYGFIAMFAKMLEGLGLGAALASRDLAERRLTNLLQLGEMLQLQSRSSPGMEALLSWYRQQLQGDAGEEAELRLESDEALVKIVTVHKSKGLEYPVVFVPFLWSCRPIMDDTRVLRFHDEHNQATLDLGSDQFERHLIIADRERLAEDVRLLYVALTRARARVYLAWGDVGDARSKGRPNKTALGYLLHSQQSVDDLGMQQAKAFANAENIASELQSLAARSQGNIELVELPDSHPPTAASATTSTSALLLRDFKRAPAIAWRINSFTSLTRDIHQVASRGEKVSSGDPILDFPAGSHIGLLLHELLEHLDFQQEIAAQCEPRIRALAPGYGIFARDQQQILLQWIQAIVATRLDQNGLSLDKLHNRQRLNELKFDFSLHQLDSESLNRFMQDNSETLLEALNPIQYRGLMTGVIDLVFEYAGRYYLADYKSNFLGASLDDYIPSRLQQAMLDRRYDFQSLLYSVALHRYLARRLPDYDYAQHFGGSYYLFLRAMRPQSGEDYGVHFYRPPADLLQAFDQLLGYSSELVANL